MEVTQAWTGLQALEHFAKSEPFRFDAVLLDMQMPVCDGPQFLKRIREDMLLSSVPVIVITANAVSYTHLDVYKRQVLHTEMRIFFSWKPGAIFLWKELTLQRFML